MPNGSIDFGEASVRPLPLITKNCGIKAIYEFEQWCIGILKRYGQFLTAKEIAEKYKKCT
jgi:peptidoglycan-N-acetylglucosamine deacetylase